MIQKKIITDNNEDKFLIRLNKTEKVGLITTENGSNYLILDSYEYWYDVIQDKYPSELKCKCKNNIFKLQFNYHQRSNSQDYDQIDIITICTRCKNQKTQMKIDIDYSPTSKLFEKPITFCKNPKLRFDYTEITSFWEINDVIFFLEFMKDLGFINTVWFWENNFRNLKQMDIYESKNLIKAGRYLSFLFSLNYPNYSKIENDKGFYLPGDQWKEKEIVQLRSPITILYENDQKGYLYYINYCNEYIYNYAIKSKSDDFKKNTKKIYNWFKTNYVNNRGKNCYDNKNELVRLFNNKYT
ncbi:MAG: hypothetical protein MJB14_03840 [Spirochaetes bacterium]|nr:hypothetical protein [Spirochaetota bacterium]